jgi:hypothetical protein
LRVGIVSAKKDDMKKQAHESKHPFTDGDAFYPWIPYAIAAPVFAVALIIGILSKDILMVLGSGLPALAVLLIARMAFPRD